ncbi:phosphatase PAP2 family protein [Micromonospora sp. 067-2]|uniref:phosphatase PAP2 family protein n=1 Tax=Micromonospora sp. 067-2 TaxID=2789270 RepID=UPI003979E015
MPLPRRTAVAVISSATVAFAILTGTVVARLPGLLRVDAAISASAHRAATHSTWVEVMAAITATGSTMLLLPVVALGCLLLIVRGHWRQAVFVAVAMTATIALRSLIVAAVGRPRPVDQMVAVSNFSFPSGHTAASAAAATCLALVGATLLRQRGLRILLAVAAGAWAVTVGVSRVALVVHWPSDVLGSWLLVTAIVPAVALLADLALPTVPSGTADPMDTRAPGRSKRQRTETVAGRWRSPCTRRVGSGRGDRGVTKVSPGGLFSEFSGR